MPREWIELHDSRSSAPLLCEVQPIVTDEHRAASLWRRLSARSGPETMRSCLEAWCSDLPGRETALCRVMIRLARERVGVLESLCDPDVLLVHKAGVRTRAQAHLHLGIIRFSELTDGTMYAAVQPECDILALVADHFSARFPCVTFVIHDRRRDFAVLHPPGGPWHLVEGFTPSWLESPRLEGEGVLVKGAMDGSPPLSAAELQLREGWVRYFTSVSIESRENRTLQMSHVPKKYWRDLPEMVQNGE